MAEHERNLVNDRGDKWRLPPCPPATDALYEADGWKDAPEDAPWPDLIGEAFAKAELANRPPATEPAPSPESEPASSTDGPERVDDSLTKAELLEIANDPALGIDVPSSATKAEIVALIDAAQPEHQEP